MTTNTVDDARLPDAVMVLRERLADEMQHHGKGYAEVERRIAAYNAAIAALTAAGAGGEALEAAYPWQPIESAPVGTPMSAVYFLAYCPDDDWSPLIRVHVACRYEHTAPGMVRVVGSNNDRRATHWMLPGSPAKETP